jgi:hypothetical protein
MAAVETEHEAAESGRARHSVSLRILDAPSISGVHKGQHKKSQSMTRQGTNRRSANRSFCDTFFSIFSQLLLFQPAAACLTRMGSELFH